PPGAGPGRDAHAGRAPARDVRPAGSPAGLRLSAAHPRLPPELPALRRAAQLAAHGLLHVLPRRPRGPQGHRPRMGRSRRRPGGGERPGLGRGAPVAPAGHPRPAGGPRPRGGLQLQPAAPRPEPRRPPPGLERDPQLGGHPARAALATMLALALLVASVTGPATPAGLPRFEPGECLARGDWSAGVRRECGWLVVPESRDHASGNTVRLAVEIFRAKEPSGAPPLVLLHGGPGGRGGIRTMSAGVAASPLARNRDVVIYDQRGAGFSEPQLCPAYEEAAESAFPLRDGAEKERRLREARRACIAELDAKGIDRLAYNTAASVADLIDLRRALGYASWDVYGGSYGARLAQEAMVSDAGAVRAVVLASPVARSFSVTAEQPRSTQRAFERLFAACARQPSCRQAF